MANVASGTVLVTGASSGIGEATAFHLRELGFDPVAAVRKAEDAERLATSGLRTVRMDVTDIDSIAAARAELGDGPLAGLVNKRASPSRRRSSSSRSTSSATSWRST